MPNISRSLICKSTGANYSNTYRKSKLRLKDKDLVSLIEKIRLNHPFYGIKRLKLALLFEYNLTVNKKRLSRICRQYNLQAKKKKKRNYKPLDKNLPDTRIPNLIKEMQITKPNQVWASDFTYLKFQGIWYYLATTIDVFTKEITGFHLSTNHYADLVMNAFEIGVNKYSSPEVIHSDQGSEYRSIEYQNLLKTHNTTPSNSTKSSPWQNGFQESFYGKFKEELELDELPKNSTFADIYNYIANQIDYYNNRRIHTTISNIPSNFRKMYYENLKKTKKKKIKSSDNPKETKTIKQKKQARKPC